MHTPEQNRKKTEAMRESQDHAGRNVVGDPARRFLSKTEIQANDMVKDAKAEGLDMEIER